MCDVCSDFTQLLVNCESRLSDDVSQYPTIGQCDLDTILNFILQWPQRQCMCCYRDVKNFERFYLIVQSVLCLSVTQLKQLKEELIEAAKAPPAPTEGTQEIQKAPDETNLPKNEEKCDMPTEGSADKREPSPSTPTEAKQQKIDESLQAEKSKAMNNEKELWSVQQREKLMHILSKIFLLNFPLYLACKHSALSRLDDLTAPEITNLSTYCDLHDTEIPAYLLRNVSFFCKMGGVCSMTSVFEYGTPSTLPLSMAHAIVAAVGNLKLWLNFRAVAQLFMPLRSKILKYMCMLEDKDLRVPAVKSMADFMWGAAKEPLDAPLAFDGDGLALAFKYFNSSTLTMRLAGVAQINAHIAAHNELCAGEPAADSELAGQQLATWLTSNSIIEHLFGPNLHVEVIKQSHMILKFLAVEGRVTNEHVDLVWAAAQLKHCGRQVYDLLPGFIRALAPKPCAHLYSLLCSLPPKDHTEQSLYLASALMRALWSRGAGAGGGAGAGRGADAGGCALHLHTFGRAEPLDLAAPPPRPNLLSHTAEYGRSRDSESESSGSPCAACAAELYRLPAAHLSDTLPAMESSAEDTSYSAGGGGRGSRMSAAARPERGERAERAERCERGERGARQAARGKRRRDHARHSSGPTVRYFYEASAVSAASAANATGAVPRRDAL